MSPSPYKTETLAKHVAAAGPFLKNPSAWEAPHRQSDSLRPPWEKWDAKTGGRIYVQEEGGAPGWHDENVRKVKGK